MIDRDYSLIKTFNRTMLELKLHTRLQTTVDKRTFNRTMLELKYEKPCPIRSNEALLIELC